jgi:Asparagine synthase
MRKPRLPLLWEAVRGFFPLALADVPKDMRPVPWLHQDFIRRNHAALWGYPSRVKLFGPLPSFQNNIVKLENERRQQVYVNLRHLQSEPVRDVRYPYLDRNFLEFMYAIPREQIVRVGQRRALMKRALVGIVPDELLHRRRKAFFPQQPMKRISTEWPSLTEIGQYMVSSYMGIIDANRFSEAWQKAWHDEGISLEGLVRTLTLESWLDHLRFQGVLTNSMSNRNRGYHPLEVREQQAPLSPQVQLASCVLKCPQRKEVTIMKYETPELTALTPAINAIQTSGSKEIPNVVDNPGYEQNSAYADWEE